MSPDYLTSKEKKIWYHLIIEDYLINIAVALYVSHAT